MQEWSRDLTACQDLREIGESAGVNLREIGEQAVLNLREIEKSLFLYLKQGMLIYGKKSF